MEIEVRVGNALLLGTIPGFEPDGKRVEHAFTKTGPRAVVLGIPPEDLEGLAALATEPSLVKELPEAPELDQVLFKHLEPFGTCTIPSPDLSVAYGLAMEANVPLSAADLDDETHTRLYTHKVGFMGVVKSNRLQKRLLKQAPPAGSDAYEVATWWDDALNDLKPLKAIEKAREEAMASGIQEAVAAADGAVLAIVPVPRLAGVAAALRAAT